MNLKTAEEAAAATLDIQQEEKRIREETEYNEWLERVTVGIEEAISQGLYYCEFNAFGFPEALLKLLESPPYKYSLYISGVETGPDILRISWPKKK